MKIKDRLALHCSACTNVLGHVHKYHMASWGEQIIWSNFGGASAVKRKHKTIISLFVYPFARISARWREWRWWLSIEGEAKLYKEWVLPPWAADNVHVMSTKPPWQKPWQRHFTPCFSSTSCLKTCSKSKWQAWFSPSYTVYAFFSIGFWVFGPLPFEMG